MPPCPAAPLYLIEILHQTTTKANDALLRFLLYLIEILHQTTTCGKCEDCLRRCILSKFYIKPQLVRNYYGYSQVVSYRNSTSNHNSVDKNKNKQRVVSYRNSTSNHNFLKSAGNATALYLIEILHQTTTCLRILLLLSKLYLIEILHQTTTSMVFTLRWYRCILSKFYIKPQLLR